MLISPQKKNKVTHKFSAISAIDKKDVGDLGPLNGLNDDEAEVVKWTIEE